MPKKRLLYVLMMFGYIANSLVLGRFSFADLAKIFLYWSVVFGMWWVADYFYNKNKSSAESSQLDNLIKEGESNEIPILSNLDYFALFRILFKEKGSCRCPQMDGNFISCSIFSILLGVCDTVDVS